MNPQTPPLETPLPRTMPGRVVLPTALLLLASLGSSADQFVTTCDQPSLLSALQAGGTIKLACDGTILLTQTLVIDKDTVLDAGGHHVTLSGQQSNRVLHVNAGVKCTLSGLTVADGRSDRGGGLFNEGGEVTALNCAFARNLAVGVTSTNVCSTGGDGLGGAIYTHGSFSASYCVFQTNVAQGGAGGSSSGGSFIAGGQGGAAHGGAIYAASCLVRLVGCTLAENEARGGVGGVGLGVGGGPPAWAPPIFEPAGGGGEACAGAVYLAGGTLEMARCRVSGNRAKGGSPGGYGAVGGTGRGGGAYSLGEATICDCTFNGNTASGSPGGTGTLGWTFAAFGGAFSANGGLGAIGGNGEGGAWFNGGTLLLERCTLAGNQAAGAGGGAGGAGAGGVSRPGPLGIYMKSDAGNGGAGGAGRGGAFYSQGTTTLRNTTVADNLSRGGEGGAGGAGGEFVSYSQWSPEPTREILPNGANGATGAAAGGAVFKEKGEVVLANTILAASSGADNVSGTLTDQGHNLSSDASCAFTATSSLNNADPKLLPLADNGGPTPTMALAPDSPARDQGDSALAGAADQRGVPRPIGPGSDIGAFEFVPPFSITPLPDGAMRLSFTLQPGRTAVLQATTDLRTWTDRQTSQTDTAGFFTAIDTEAPRHLRQFYRTKTP